MSGGRAWTAEAPEAEPAVLDTAAFPVEGRLVGMHGSLTAAEMLVPVLVT